MPEGVDKIYLCCKHQNGVNAVNKAAWFNEPTMLVKKKAATEHTEAYKCVHISFQSTGTTNITTVNALNSNKLYVSKKERGKGEKKRNWELRWMRLGNFILECMAELIQLTRWLSTTSYITDHGWTIGWLWLWWLPIIFTRSVLVGPSTQHWNWQRWWISIPFMIVLHIKAWHTIHMMSATLGIQECVIIWGCH